MDDVLNDIALPGAGSVGDAELGPALGAWLRSSALRELAELSAWRWPGSGSDRDLAQALVELSAEWDFRGRAAAAASTNFVERSAMPEAVPLVLHGRAVDPARVVAAARALRLVDSQTNFEFEPTHVVVLSGTARANVNRAQFAADVVGKAANRPSSIVGLTAHRELGDAERASCADLGLPATDTEWTTMRDALISAFGVDGEVQTCESGPDSGFRAIRFERSAAYMWSSDTAPVKLLVVPSPSARAERPRPANTADQLRWWTASLDGPKDGDAVLLVTTQIYVPYQQFVAAGVLRHSAPNCRLLTIGVSPANAKVPTRRFTAQDYLQEVRSALIAARDVLEQLHASD